MNNQVKHTFRLIRRHGWWLLTAIAVIAASAQIGQFAAGAKATRGDAIFWVAIALAWMVTQFLTEVQQRRWKRRAEQAEKATP